MSKGKLVLTAAVLFAGLAGTAHAEIFYGILRAADPAHNRIIMADGTVFALDPQVNQYYLPVGKNTAVLYRVYGRVPVAYSVEPVVGRTGAETPPSDKPSPSDRSRFGR